MRLPALSSVQITLGLTHSLSASPAITLLKEVTTGPQLLIARLELLDGTAISFADPKSGEQGEKLLQRRFCRQGPRCQRVGSVKRDIGEHVPELSVRFLEIHAPIRPILEGVQQWKIPLL